MDKKIEKQTIYEIYRACRLCGAGGGYKMPIIQNVVNLDNCDVELKQKIRECVQIEVHQDDKMPPLICELCVDKVNDFYEFLEMCRQTNKRTRLKLGLPPQMMPRGAPDAGDCILGVTEPIFVNDEDSNEPLADKKCKIRGSKINQGPGKQLREVRIKLEDRISPRESRSSRHRLPSPPRLRRDKRPNDNVTLSRLQDKVKKSLSPPPKSILKKGVQKKPETSPQSPTTRLKRFREAEVKSETPPKRVKISLKSLPLRSTKESPRSIPLRTQKRDDEVKRKHEKKKEMKNRETEAEKARKLQTVCQICRTVFKTPQAMKSHMRSHVVTYTNPRLACNPCELWFSSAEEIEAHHKRHRRQGLRYRCRRCSYSSTALHGYDEHIERGNCLPWEEEPDKKCDDCWKTFPTQNLMNRHRCPGVGARPVKCTKCGKTYATKKSLTNHSKTCKKGNVNIAPEMLARLKTLQVRVAKCDPLLVNMKQGHYNVSSARANFGLDKNCFYPYISSGLRIKTELSDCMVKINDLDFGNYVHWDSEDESGDSGDDNLNSYDISDFSRKRQVDSLVACSLKTIFSSRFLGKVPKKFRRVKIETIIDSTLNDSLSDLNLNGGDTISENKADVKDKKSVGNEGNKKFTVSEDKNNTERNNLSNTKSNVNEDDEMFPKKNCDEIVTNDDFDSLFNDNNDKTYTSNNGDTCVLGSDAKIQELGDKNSDNSVNVNDPDVLGNGDKENSDSINVMTNNKSIDTVESTKVNIVNNVVADKSTDIQNLRILENQSNVNINNSNLKSLRTDIKSTKEIIGNYETKLDQTEIANLSHDENRVISEETIKQACSNSLEGSLGDDNSQTNVCTENFALSEITGTLSTEYDKETPINVEKLHDHIEKIKMQIAEENESLNTRAEGETNNHCKLEDKAIENDKVGISESSLENKSDSNVNINGSNEECNSIEAEVNGDEVDEVALNMNDLEDLSGSEFDDCELMAEIDAQIGEKKRETMKKPGLDENKSKNEKATEIDKHLVEKDEKSDRKETKTDDMSAEPVEKKASSKRDAEIKQDKIASRVLLPNQDQKSMDLDSISDDEFDFND